MQDKKTTLGWGKKQEAGVEIWDTNPVFLGESVEFKDWCKLLFFPKKWFLYRYIVRSLGKNNVNNLVEEEMSDGSKYYVENMGDGDANTPLAPLKGGLKVLDVGCGTGASLVDFKKIFGRSVEVVGVDVVALQVELAKDKIKKNGVYAEVLWYDGEHLPFEKNSFDAIYTSDVLGHVQNVSAWLQELNRVLKPGGALAMFSESKLGKQAYIRNYLMKRGLNTDPHAEFHISLYSKIELKNLLNYSGFKIEKMYSAFWASFLVHPEDFFCHPESPDEWGEGSLFNTSKTGINNPLNETQKRDSSPDANRGFGMTVLKIINKFLYWLKKKTHPYSTALCELYGLIEMYLVGKWVEAQGYVILAQKK